PRDDRIQMRLGVGVLCSASVLVGLLAVSGATAATQRHVRLTIEINGSGSVRLSDGRGLACSSKCHKMFAVRAGAKLVLTARPGSGWSLSHWFDACQGSGPTCRLRLRHYAGAGFTFGPPGSTTANPIPLGQAATFYDGWVVRIVSATIDATDQIVAIPGNYRPPPGAQYTMVNLSATYTGGGSAVLDPATIYVGDRFAAIGTRNYPYGYCPEKLPPPVLTFSIVVYSGQTESGNVCYLINSDDASSLELMAFGGEYRTYFGYFWFALR